MIDDSPLKTPLAVAAWLLLGTLQLAEGEVQALPCGDAEAPVLRVSTIALSEGSGESLRQALCVW